MKKPVLAIQKPTAGAALLAALGLLLIFLTLGMGYIAYMITNAQESGYDALQLRAKTAARGGIDAGIAEMQKALAANTADKLIAAGVKVELPVYKMDKNDPKTLAANENLKSVAEIGFEDESGKVNINHAPPRVLQAVLGVDGETARKIRASLPVEGTTGAQWMADVDELSTRQLLSEDAYAKLPRNLISVDNVADQKNPEAYLNINAAPAEVLAAVFDITKAAAEDLAKKRPFATYADAATATGKDPSTFNLAPAPDGSPAKELGLQSRCFRIVSRAKLDVPGNASRSVAARVEAVVVFAKDGTPCVTFWSETPEPKTAEPKPAAQ